jgi:hypothetical protein
VLLEEGKNLEFLKNGVKWGKKNGITNLWIKLPKLCYFKMENGMVDNNKLSLEGKSK